MDYFGINSADDLPRIKEVLADQIVEPRVVKNTELLPPKGEEARENLMLTVTEDGELIEKDKQ
jgi:segregation and condensation protein B